MVVLSDEVDQLLNGAVEQLRHDNDADSDSDHRQLRFRDVEEQGKKNRHDGDQEVIAQVALPPGGPDHARGGIIETAEPVSPHDPSESRTFRCARSIFRRSAGVP